VGENQDDAYLQHYGVKGMSWGVRKDRSQLRAAANKREARKVEKAEKWAQKKVSKGQGKEALGKVEYKAREIRRTEVYSKAVEARGEAFDAAVARNPAIRKASSLSKAERSYLENKVVNRIILQNGAELYAKKEATKALTEKAMTKYGAKSFTDMKSKQDIAITLGITVASKALEHQWIKGNASALNQAMTLKKEEKLTRRSEALRKATS